METKETTEVPLSIIILGALAFKVIGAVLVFKFLKGVHP
jgi:hypothetical protein